MRNLPIVLAGVIVIGSILLVVVGDSSFISVDQYTNDKILVRSPSPDLYSEKIKLLKWFSRKS